MVLTVRDSPPVEKGKFGKIQCSQGFKKQLQDETTFVSLDFHPEDIKKPMAQRRVIASTDIPPPPSLKFEKNLPFPERDDRTIVLVLKRPHADDVYMASYNKHLSSACGANANFVHLGLCAFQQQYSI